MESLICGIASVVVTSGSGSMALFVGMVFAAIGVIFTVISTRKIMVDISTHKNGYETFGIVIDIAPTTTTVNGNPVLEATVAVVTEGGSVDEYIESIGADGRKYVIGILLELSIIYMTSTLRERRTRTSFRKM